MDRGGSFLSYQRSVRAANRHRLVLEYRNVGFRVVKIEDASPHHVVRGGSFKGSPWRVRAAVRGWNRGADDDAGFRVVANNRRVVRGGAFLDYEYYVRCAYRFGLYQEYRNGYIGFRVVKIAVYTKE